VLIFQTRPNKFPTRGRKPKLFAERTNWNLEPNRLSRALAARRASGKPILDLTLSNPTECGFRYAEHPIRTALCSPEILHYRPDPKGISSARAAVAKYYSELGAAADLEAIFLTVSTSESYSFAFRLLCNPGDELLVPAPSYPLFDFLAEIHDVKLIRYPLLYENGWRVNFHALEKSLTARTRAVIVVHPNNPTGHYTKSGELAQLNHICAARELALIADEVFLDFALREETPHSFAANSTALTLTASGISKICGLPQMKAAWLAISGPQAAKTQAIARLEVLADTYLSLNTPVQLALPTFLDGRFELQRQLISRVKRNLAELDAQVAAQRGCVRLTVEGGWYAVLQIASITEEEEFATGLLQDSGVYVHPGHFFEFASPGYLVLSLITPEKEFSTAVQLLLARANEQRR